MCKVIMVILVTTCLLGLNCVEANALSDTTLQTLKEDRKVTENNKTILCEFMDEVWNKGNMDAADKFIASP